MATKKYVSLSKLSTFLDNLKNIFATKTEVNSKADTDHTHTVANISDLTATATELNYMDGVTSNVQAQLDGIKEDAKSFIATPNVTTYADAMEAYNAGKAMYCYDTTEDRVGVLYRVSESEICWVASYYQYLMRYDLQPDDTWNIYEVPLAPDISNLTYLGENITSGSANDTTEFWADKESGRAWFSADGMLVDQPSTYGILINYTYAADVFQIFRSQSEGPTYFRSGNMNGWSGTWEQVVTISEFDLTTMGMSAIPADGTAVTLTTDTTAIRNAMANGDVKLSFQFQYYGNTLNADAVASSLYLEISDEYQAVFNTVVSGVPACVCFSVSATQIVARAIPLQSVTNGATKPSMTRITLSASSWDATALTQSVTVTGISADETAQIIQCAPYGASMTAAVESGIYCSGQGADSLTFTCTSVPTEDVVMCITWQDAEYV